MSAEKTLKRRAVYTGLHPYLETDLLTFAMETWETRYADRNNFTLQHFIADLCDLEPVRQQRSRILISLVKAMNTPADALMPDPRPGTAPVAALAESAGTSEAFARLLACILDLVPPANRHAHLRDNVRLDILDSLDSRTLSPALTGALRAWLSDGDDPNLPEVPPGLLRGLTNRTYVILCERLGPVAADRLLAAAVTHCQADYPELKAQLEQLL